jgi:hypothetical protein
MRRLAALALFCAALPHAAAAREGDNAEASAADPGPPAPASVEAYFDRLQDVFRADSDAADVDRLLALFTGDGRYVHLKYAADFDLAAWRAAFLRNIDRGAFTASADACIAITNHIPGDGVAAIEYAYGTRSGGGDCRPANDERLLVMFQLEGERIARVEELW